MLAFAFSAINGLVGDDLAQANGNQKRVLNFLSSSPITSSPLFTSKPNPKADSEWPVEAFMETSPEPSPSCDSHTSLAQENVVSPTYLSSQPEISVDGLETNDFTTSLASSIEAWGIDDFEFEKNPAHIPLDEKETIVNVADSSQGQTHPGVDPIYNLLSYSSSVPVDHVVIGDFEAAMMVSFSVLL